MNKRERIRMLHHDYAPRGSDLYYVLRKVKYDKRPGYLALSALCFELNRCSEQYQEVAIAEKKLCWFGEEIERFFLGRANHPVLQALQPYRACLSKNAMLALVEANLHTLNTHIFETRSELLQHYQHLGGIAFDLKAAVLGGKYDVQTNHTLGLLDELLRHLLYFGRFLNRQHLCFALEDFQNRQIDPAPVLQMQKLKSLQPLFDEYYAYAKEHFLKQKSIVNTPLTLEVLLKLKQAEIVARDGWQFFRHQVELSPLRKLFLTF